MADLRNSARPERLLQLLAGRLQYYFSLTDVGVNPHIAVGLSGGRDSVALLYALYELRGKFLFQLSACHVNHGLSPFAAEWQDHCVRMCRTLDIPYSTQAVVVPSGTGEGPEASARRVRYESFSALDCDLLALAQHRRDHAETLLLNLLRGCGLAGAAAIPEVRLIKPSMWLIRPFLQLSRLEIDHYLASRSLTWVEDESNEDVRYSRNFLRHDVFPLLEKRFSAAEKNIASAADKFREANLMLDDLAVIDLAGVRPDFPIQVVVFEKLPEMRARNLLRYLLALKSIRIPSDAKLKEALRQMIEATPDRHPCVEFDGWTLLRAKKMLMLHRVEKF
jgi:tRNA(Ile)-lysidine synthase